MTHSGRLVSSVERRPISTHSRDRNDRVALERLAYNAAEWDAIVGSYQDAEVYQTSAWLEYLSASQRAEPVIALVRRGGRPVGHFVGAIVRRFGVRILGSPLRGWTTQCMGFLLEEGIDRRAAAEALIPFAFRDLGCLHVELADRRLTPDAMQGTAFECETGISFRVDLSQPEVDILQAFHRTARKEVRRAVAAGLEVQTATDDAFADEFYGYLRATFGRQGLTPTFGADRVRALISALLPSGKVHLLRVCTASGRSIATSISIGYGHTAIIWGMGFDRSVAEYHPIDLLWWHTIRSWQTLGVSVFDLAGAGSYKAKHGGVVTPTAHYYRSRWPALRAGRSLVRQLARGRQLLGGLPTRLDGPHPNEGGKRETPRATA